MLRDMSFWISSKHKLKIKGKKERKRERKKERKKRMKRKERKFLKTYYSSIERWKKLKRGSKKVENTDIN